MRLGLTKSRDDKLLQDLLDKKLRVIVVFEDDYLNHIARIAYKDIQQDNYTYRIGEYNIYKGEEWGFCDFCKRHDCYFIVPNETIEGGSSETPNDLEEAAEISFDEAYALTEDYRDFLAKGLTENKPRPIGPHWFCEYAKNRFIAGAKWQKEQMLKEAVEGEVVVPIYEGYNTWSSEIKIPGRHEIGDKVCIIVKENEK